MTRPNECAYCGYDLEDYCKCERQEQMIYVLTIDGRYGLDAWAFTTVEAASRRLDRYVTERWNEQIDGPMPEDLETRIEEYFEGNDRENYQILNLEVEG